MCRAFTQKLLACFSRACKISGTRSIFFFLPLNILLSKFFNQNTGLDPVKRLFPSVQCMDSEECESSAGVIFRTQQSAHCRNLGSFLFYSQPPLFVRTHYKYGLNNLELGGLVASSFKNSGQCYSLLFPVCAKITVGVFLQFFSFAFLQSNVHSSSSCTVITAVLRFPIFCTAGMKDI